MRSGSMMSSAFLVTAGGVGVRSVAAWGVRTAALGGGGKRLNSRWANDRWTSPIAPCCGIRTRAGSRPRNSSGVPPTGSSLKDTDVVAENTTVEDMAVDNAVAGDVELKEGEELLSTVEVTPQHIADFFAQPSYEPVHARADDDAAEPEDLLDSRSTHVIVTDSFLEDKTASTLRGVFEDRFSKPREGQAERFVWDWWHVKNQYTLMRTPAEEYFGEEAFNDLFEELTRFGQEKLGCTAISPPWLSVYVDGCEQRFHTDSWHGPWAFVLSLTDWEKRGFTGGETMILKPHVLDYWRSFQPGIGLEEQHFLDLVEPHFNRLTVFDPRFPHGVRPVGGTHDPLEGRLVLHGWFTDPQPFFTGGLDAEEATEPLNKALEQIYPALEGVGTVTGVLTVRLHVSGETGAIFSVVPLTDTLVADPNDSAVDEEGAEEDSRTDVLAAVKIGCEGARFPKATQDTFITVPFVFE